MQKKIFSLGLTALLLATGTPKAWAKEQHGDKRTLPFSQMDDEDGARFVWFIYKESGFPFPYVPSSGLQDSPRFKPAPGNKPQVGDVGWWKTYVGIYTTKRDAPFLRTASGLVALMDIEKKLGPVTWLRYDVPEGKKKH